VVKIRPSRLEPDLQLALVNQTIEVAASGFEQDPSNEAFSDDVKKHILEATELYLVYEETECIAFAAIANFTVETTKVLYLGGLMVKRSRQRNGLMRDLIRHEISQSKPEILAARTQNPCILDLMKEFCINEELYPLAGPPQGESRIVFEYLAKSMGMGNMDQESLVGRGTYGKRLYGNGTPLSRNSESNRVFRQIDPNKGDSILLIGRVAL